MSRVIGLIVSLSVGWLLLSGMFQPLLLSFGVVSVALIVWLVLRMDRVDGAPCIVPIRWLSVPAYLLWLGREVVIANIDVIRRVVGAAPVDPAVVEVDVAPRTDFARATFANSVTLTPGTLSIAVIEEPGTNGDRLLVHALSSEGAQALAEGDMGERVAALERPSVRAAGASTAGRPS